MYVKNHGYCYVEMPEEDNKMLKYNHGEKSMKHPFIVYAYLITYVYLKKWTLVIIILKNHHEQLNYMNIKLLVIQCLHIVYLMLQKINQIVIEAKTVWKIFVKT